MACMTRYQGRTKEGKKIYMKRSNSRYNLTGVRLLPINKKRQCLIFERIYMCYNLLIQVVFETMHGNFLNTSSSYLN